jgi:hypothetical protein
MDDIYSLLLLQYKQSPNVLGFIYALVGAPYERFTEQVSPLRTLYDIDLSEGVQLDGIGGIIGQPRPKSFNDADIFAEGIFSLGDANDPQPEFDTETGFGDTADPNVGGRWDRGETEGLSLGDIDYQKLLRGRVHINRSRGTIADFERYGEITFGTPANAYPYIGAVLVAFPYYLNSIAIQVVLETLKMNLGIRTIIAAMTVPDRKVFGYGSITDNTPIEVLTPLLDEDDTPITTDEGVPLAATSIEYAVTVGGNIAGYGRYENDPDSGYMISIQ